MEYTLLGLDINEGKEGQGGFCMLGKDFQSHISLNLEWKTKCVSVIMERVKMV